MDNVVKCILSKDKETTQTTSEFLTQNTMHFDETTQKAMPFDETIQIKSEEMKTK